MPEPMPLPMLIAPLPTGPLHPSDQRAVLESIAHTLCQGALTDPAEDLGAWVAGVEVIEALKRAGFSIVRRDTSPATAGFRRRHGPA